MDKESACCSYDQKCTIILISRPLIFPQILFLFIKLLNTYYIYFILKLRNLVEMSFSVRHCCFFFFSFELFDSSSEQFKQNQKAIVALKVTCSRSLELGRNLKTKIIFIQIGFIFQKTSIPLRIE